MKDENKSVFDKGPWTVGGDNKSEVWLDSEDFNHDVLLRVTGDFANFAQRKAYGEYLAGVLTRGCALEHATQALRDEGGLLAALNAAAQGPQGGLLLAAAEEIARLRSVLAEADAALERLQVSEYMRNKLQQAKEPTALAVALQTVLGQGT